MRKEIAEAHRLERKYLDAANEADRAKLQESQRLAAMKRKEIENKSKALEELIKTKKAHELRDKEIIAKQGNSKNENQILLIVIACLLLLAVFT